MQFYKIIHAGGIEFDTVRTAAQNRAKETGGSWEAIEMGNDKTTLIAYFNDLAKEASGGAITPQPVVSDNEPIPEPVSTSRRDSACVKCKFDYRSQERWLEFVKRNLTVDAVKQWIEEREGWELSTIVEALTRRLSDLAQTITGKSKQAA